MNTINKLIYLDYASTTPVDKRVAEKMSHYLTIDGVFANPASRSHSLGWHAEEAVEIARDQIAEAIGASPLEIVFTSGATESDNLAIKGTAQAFGKGHIITSQIEHKAVLDSCKFLETQGFTVTYLQPQPQTGLILPEQVEQALRDDTILVSLMMVNNEIGTITDFAKIGEITRKAGVIFHVDCAQGFGKVDFDLSKLNIDLMSLSGHKIYAPKGIGVLYVRKNDNFTLQAQMHGGNHERGMRSGTLPTHQIVAMGEAFEIARQDFVKDTAHLKMLKQRFWQGLQDIDGIQLNGDYQQSVANIINIGFINPVSVMTNLKRLAVSSGSACNSKSLAPSFVLTAIGVPDEIALNSIRFSFGRFTTQSDIDTALQLIHDSLKHCEIINKVRST